MQFLTQKKNIKLKKKNTDIICFYSGLSAIWNRHRNGSGSQCHSGIKKLSLLLHHVDVRSWESERKNECRKKRNKPGWFHLYQAKEGGKEQVFDTQNFFEFDRQTQRCVKNNRKWERKIKILYYARWQRWRSIKRLNVSLCFSSALIWSTHRIFCCIILISRW